MMVLLAGLLLFLLPHLFREFGLRTILVKRLGEAKYKGLYSLLSLLGIILIIYGKSLSPFIQLWTPSYPLRYIGIMLMFPALVLFAAGNMPMSHIRRHVRHPMLAGTVVWGASHLWTNGDLASLLIFGGIATWALVKAIALSRTQTTSTVTPSLKWDFMSLVIVGPVLYAVLILSHGTLFGVTLTLG